jgi:hypothetical protein
VKRGQCNKLNFTFTNWNANILTSEIRVAFLLLLLGCLLITLYIVCSQSSFRPSGMSLVVASQRGGLSGGALRKKVYFEKRSVIKTG